MHAAQGTKGGLGKLVFRPAGSSHELHEAGHIVLQPSQRRSGRMAGGSAGMGWEQEQGAFLGQREEQQVLLGWDRERGQASVQEASNSEHLWS